MESKFLLAFLCMALEISAQIHFLGAYSTYWNQCHGNLPVLLFHRFSPSFVSSLSLVAPADADHFPATCQATWGRHPLTQDCSCPHGTTSVWEIGSVNFGACATFTWGQMFICVAPSAAIGPFQGVFQTDNTSPASEWCRHKNPLTGALFFFVCVFASQSSFVRSLLSCFAFCRRLLLSRWLWCGFCASTARLQVHSLLPLLFSCAFLVCLFFLLT